MRRHLCYTIFLYCVILFCAINPILAQINIDEPMRAKLAEAKMLKDIHLNSNIDVNGNLKSNRSIDEYDGIVPILSLRFYLMGEKNIDAQLANNIYSAVEELNKEFENQIKFQLAGIRHEKNHTSLNTLYASFFDNSDSIVASLVEPIELTGSINIYLCNNVKKSIEDQALMGFTPILLNQRHAYKDLSPEYDRIFMAYKSISNKTTLIHEMGHFLGLSHPWELSKTNLTLLGLLSNSKIDQNHMAYGSQVSEFTEEQFIIMRDYTFRFRNYLLSDHK